MANAKSTLLQSTLLTVFGSAFLWAWGYICYLSPAMFPYETVTGSVGIEQAFFVSQIVAALFAVVVVAVTRTRQISVAPHWFFVAALAVALSTIALELILYDVLPTAVFYLCGIVDGVAVPVMGIAWGTRYSLGSPGKFRIGSIVLLSFLVAYGIYYVVSLLPYGPGMVIAVAAPVISWGAWRIDAQARHALSSEVFPARTLSKGNRTRVRAGEATLKNTASQTRAIDVSAKSAPVEGSLGEVTMGDKSAAILPWRAISLFAFAAFAANLVSSFVMGWDYQSTSIIAGGFLIVAIITTAAYTMSMVERNTVPIGSMYRFALPFTVVGLLIMLVFGYQGATVGGALVSGCGMFMQSLLIYKVSESTQDRGISPLVSFSVAQGVIAAMVFFGNVFGKYLFSATGPDVLWLDLLCAAMILVLFLLMLYILQPTGDAAMSLRGEGEGGGSVSAVGSTSGGLSGQGEAADQADKSEVGSSPQEDEILAHIADKHSLTPRELEVLSYLSKGRSLPYIADQLFVTTGTIKTHTVHIYRKLEVNSRQELLDLIESKATDFIGV